MITTCVLVAENPAVGRLLAMAHEVSEETIVIVAGPRSLADTVAGQAGCKVHWIASATEPVVEALAPAVIDLVVSSGARVVLAVDAPSERTLLGQVAAKLGATCLVGVSGFTLEEENAVITRTAFNGVVERQEVVSMPVALVVADEGEFASSGVGTLIEVTTQATYPITLVSQECATTDTVDLGGAKTVVGVGRGFKEEADLDLAEAIAVELGAGMACSRPVAEGMGWLPRDRYLGVSGRTIAPDLYIAVGISGQIQHMVGARSAGTIVAINSDPHAPIFNECDLGVVGDLYQVLPALKQALKRRDHVGD